jgi:mannose-1-phosphate guanylyltransferase
MYWAVILAGGSGTRLWPMSREEMPKQALTLVGERSMFQHSVDRLLPLFPIERILVVTRAEYSQLLLEQMPELPEQNFIIEPVGRGTAPAIGLAAVHLKKRDPNAVMAILTADHFIKDTDSFRRVLNAAETAANAGYLVTLGIQPTFPSTGFGYIEQGDPIDSEEIGGIFHVSRFIEKPDQETALQLVADGRYTWNSGMFVWRVDRIMEELALHMPALFEGLSSIYAHINQTDNEDTMAVVWEQVQKETIDYGVMEKADRIAVLPASIGWVDVGSWSSMALLHSKDADGNIWTSPHIGIDTSGIICVAPRRKLVATIGVADMIIVDTPDALLVCNKDREQDVRAVLSHKVTTVFDDTIIGKG